MDLRDPAMAETGFPSDIQSPLVGKQTPLSIYKLINAKPKEVVLRLRGESSPVEGVVVLEKPVVIVKELRNVSGVHPWKCPRVSIMVGFDKSHDYLRGSAQSHCFLWGEPPRDHNEVRLIRGPRARVNVYPEQLGHTRSLGPLSCL